MSLVIFIDVELLIVFVQYFSKAQYKKFIWR